MRDRPHHLLGVSPGVAAPRSAAALAVLDVLALAAAAGARVSTLVPDADSQWALSIGGVAPVPMPAALASSAVGLPVGGGVAYPVPALWPASVVATPESIASHADGAQEAMRRSWRARVLATAYPLHRADPFDLVVCAPGTTGADAAAVLAVEAAVAVLVLVDGPEPAPVLDLATEVWTLDSTAPAVEPHVTVRGAGTGSDRAELLRDLLARVAP